MKILFFTAALAVITSAYERMLRMVALDNGEEPIEIFNQEGMLSITSDWSFDVGYKVFYTNDLNEEDDGVEQDYIGVNVNSEATTTIYFTILDMFEFEIAFDLVIFDLTPFQIGIYYTRPSALVRGDDQQVYIAASYSVGIMQLTTTTRKDLELPAVSLLDAYLDGEGAWGPTEESYTYQDNEAIEDLTWTIDMFAEFVAKGDENLEAWYAGDDYIRFDLVKLPEEPPAPPSPPAP